MVFSDKTGTLTSNKMVFKKCQINGIKYGEKEKNEEDELLGMCKSASRKLKKLIKEESGYTAPNFPSATEFFKLLALCNTVVCEYDQENQDVKYSASSPDELALVQGASQAGI